MASLLLFLITFTSIYSITSETINCGEGQSCKCSKNSHCYIKCNGKDACKGSDITLTCKSGYSCTIKCTGIAACQDASIDGSKAKDVTVICEGTDACKGSSGSIVCGSGNCLMECIGDTVCVDTKIDTNDAESFQCTGGDCPQNLPKQYSPNPTPSPTIFPTKIPISSTIIDINSSQTTLSSSIIELMGSTPNSASSSDQDANDDDNEDLIARFAKEIKKRGNIVVLCLSVFGLCMCLSVCLFRRRKKKHLEQELDTVESDSDGDAECVASYGTIGHAMSNDDNNSVILRENTMMSDTCNAETGNDEPQGLPFVNQDDECFDDNDSEYDY